MCNDHLITAGPLFNSLLNPCLMGKPLATFSCGLWCQICSTRSTKSPLKSLSTLRCGGEIAEEFIHCWCVVRQQAHQYSMSTWHQAEEALPEPGYVRAQKGTTHCPREPWKISRTVGQRAGVGCRMHP